MASQDLPMLRAALEGRPSNEVRKDFRENTRTRRYGRMKTGMRSKSFGEGIFDAELDDAINRRLDDESVRFHSGKCCSRLIDLFRYEYWHCRYEYD
jgi:hypothetical protein